MTHLHTKVTRRLGTTVGALLIVLLAAPLMAGAAAGQDTTEPTVTITSPKDGAKLSESRITIEGHISEDSALKRVWIIIDGNDDEKIHIDDPTGTSFDFSNTVGLSHGKHTITVVAQDQAKNEGTATVTVTILETKEGSGGQTVPATNMAAGLVAFVVALGLATIGRARIAADRGGERR